MSHSSTGQPVTAIRDGADEEAVPHVTAFAAAKPPLTSTPLLRRSLTPRRGAHYVVLGCCQHNGSSCRPTPGPRQPFVTNGRSWRGSQGWTGWRDHSGGTMGAAGLGITGPVRQARQPCLAGSGPSKHRRAADIPVLDLCLLQPALQRLQAVGRLEIALRHGHRQQPQEIDMPVTHMAGLQVRPERVRR